MASKTAYQFYHDEQMKSSKKNDGKQAKDIQKQIGAAWTAMTQKEKQPYIEKKRQYDEQLQREQQALKRFQKQGNNGNANAEKSRDNSKVATDKKNESQNNKSQAQLKFVKTDLKKENVDAQKKVIVNGTAAAQKVHQIPGGKLATTGVSANDNSKKLQIVKQSQSGNSSKPRESTVEKGIPSAQDQPETNRQAYLEFFREQFVRYKKQFPKRDQNELTKVISQEWKLMGLSLKIRQKENKTQSKQNKKFGVSRSSSSSGKGRILIAGKEVDVPQKPLSGYLRFYKKNYEIYKTEQPELTSNMIAGLASAKWNSLTEDQKQEFNAPYTQELAAFQREKEEFIVRHGFFPSQNGQRNNDSKAVVKPNEKKEQQPIKQAENGNAQKTKSKSIIPKKNYIVFNGSHIEYPVRLSGYYLFDKTLRAQLATKKHTMNSRELSAFIGEQWKSFPAESKEEFELQQEKEYLKKRVAFIAKYGPFPEKEKKESHRKKTDEEKKPKEAKNLNGKRSNDQALPEEGKQKKKVKLSEEEMQKKIERRGRINYENPDSEVEDMLSCLEDDDDQDNLKTEKEEDFETFERNYNNNKSNITQENKKDLAATTNKKTNKVQISETNTAKVASTKKDTVKQQNKNPLFDLLNQPIGIPDFTFGPSFF